MEIIIVIALIIIIFLLIGIRSAQNEIAEKNLKNFQSLKNDLRELKKGNIIHIPEEEKPPIKATDEEVVQWRPYKAPPPVEKPIVTGEKIIEEEKTAEQIPAPPLQPMHQTETDTESFWDKWMRNNPDLEKFIGENLINKIGIAVLVLGIAFFVKYAIDKDWIHEIGRVCIGIGCGVILVSIAHRLRNSYRSFSSVMAGGGIAVFYFTIAFAFHEYALFSQPVAFMIMVVITAFAVTLSLLYDKIELAVIAVVGGFLVPFLVSTGSNNYVALFTYLLILNTGILIIAYFKKWPLLHVISFFFTLIIFGIWLLQEFLRPHPVQFPYKTALLFASAYYIIFLTTVLIHNIRKQKPFRAFDFSLILAITVSYYAEGMSILSEWNQGAHQGIFNIALGILNLCIAWYLFKSQRGEKKLLYLLIGLTATFVSLAAPVQLDGHSITLFWSAETVLLFWLYQRSDIRTFKYFSAIVFVAMFISLMIDWSLANQYKNGVLPIIFDNWKGITTNMVAVISLGSYAWLLNKAPQDQHVLGIKNKSIFIFMLTLCVLVLYATCIFGINLYFITEQNFNVPNPYHQLITYSFIAGILYAAQRFRFIEPLPKIILIVVAFFFYLFSCLLANQLITGVVENKYPVIHEIMHWLADAGLLYLIYQSIRITRKDPADSGTTYTWLNCLLLLVFFSLECKLLYVATFANSIDVHSIANQYLKAGLTIVWAVFSFVLMWLGMKHKYKPLRIISLSIFCMALLKLFLFDIRNIAAGGKIAAFIMLGALLLIISFMYQRLKKIIIDDENKTI